jgi:hypothetical protein
MAKRMQLDPKSLQQWASEEVVWYASCTLRGARLALQVRLYDREFRVIHGDETLYSGTDAEKATEVFNNA